METMKRATGSRRVTRVCWLATASLLLATIAAGQAAAGQAATGQAAAGRGAPGQDAGQGAGQAAAPQPTTIPGAASHIYKSINGVDLRLHVFTPPGQRPGDRRPAIVLFFGGGWNQGSIMQFVPQATHFASRGMVAIVADYRVRFRHDSTPYQSIADAKSAMRWVRSHALALGIDPERILAGGGSSGGHLALATAMIDGFDEPTDDRSTPTMPKALVLFNPAVDTTREVFRDRFADRGRDASPLHHVRGGLPPMIIVHGKADTTVPYSDVEALCVAIKGAGNRCELFGYDGATHGFFNQQVSGGRWFRETLLEADRYLTKLGYLPGPSPASLP
jgi:acetyl esterase/lipase